MTSDSELDMLLHQSNILEIGVVTVPEMFVRFWFFTQNRNFLTQILETVMFDCHIYLISTIFMEFLPLVPKLHNAHLF